MRSKIIRLGLVFLVIAFLGFNSVYLRKLDEVKKTAASKEDFDVSAYARNFYMNQLLSHTDSAVVLSSLISYLKKDPESAFKNYSKSLAVGNIKYFLVQGEGTITSVLNDVVTIQLGNDTGKVNANIATEFVYGNAIRDASGLISLNDFSNTAVFNSISEKINEIVRKEVLPPFVADAKEGSKVKFAGAIEMNQKYFDINAIEIIPVRLSLIKTEVGQSR